MLKIGDFSKLSRISIRMLRHYNELGLLIPKSTDRFTSYRYYSESQLPIANQITSLKEMGFSLAVIGEILRSGGDPDALTQLMRLRQVELGEQADKTKKQLRLLEHAINRLSEDKKMMNYSVTLKTIPERYVASVRKTIPNYEQEGLLWGILMEETARLNMQDGDPCYALALFHDKEYKETDVDVEVQKSVKGNYPNTENVVFKTEPEMKIASATYQGSYEQINEVTQAVANWVSDNGYVFHGAMFNIYHVSPNETKNPNEWVTEVCFQVEKNA